MLVFIDLQGLVEVVGTIIRGSHEYIYIPNLVPHGQI